MFYNHVELQKLKPKKNFPPELQVMEIPNNNFAKNRSWKLPGKFDILCCFIRKAALIGCFYYEKPGVINLNFYKSSAMTQEKFKK